MPHAYRFALHALPGNGERVVVEDKPCIRQA